MLITAIPREDMNSVSTRINYYYYLNNLPDGYTWKKHHKTFGDVLYVQKKADEKTVKIAKKAKRNGVPVVYSCDDNPYERHGKRRVTMLKLASAVTCDTENRKTQLIAASGQKNVFVIPECIDYYGLLYKLKIRDVARSIVTFGNSSNSVNALKYLRQCPLPCRHINSKKIPGAGKFVRWKLSTFVSEMHKADICLLAHGDDLKSNLKLLVCIAMGMPAIVSNTTAYRDTLEPIGLGWLVIKSPKDVPEIIKRLTPKSERLAVVEKYKEYDLSKRTPSVSAKCLADVFSFVRNNYATNKS